MSSPPRYYALHNMKPQNMTCAITEKDFDEEDERITAWDRIVRHPFFNAAFHHNDTRPLIDSMIELLDRALSPVTSKGERSMTEIFRATDRENDSLWVSTLDTAYERGQGYSLHARTAGNEGAYLTLKDVAALHKALGDHLECHKRILPREGAVRFSGGDIAAYNAFSSSWWVNGEAYSAYALEDTFGTDWEELVVKDA